MIWLAVLATIILLSTSNATSVPLQQQVTDTCKLHSDSPSKIVVSATETTKFDKYGYLFLFFRDDTEQINAGLSVGDDALNFNLWNNGTGPILSSNVGTMHTRDPFLVRSPDGNKNWIIATDNSLAAYKGDFDKAQRVSSRSITVYESVGGTLSKFKAARLTTALAGPWSGGVSAPEAYWDAEKGKFLVTFGSNRFADEDVQHNGNFTPSQIYYTYTSDFVTFDIAKPYYNITNGGLSDMTIAPLGTSEAYVRFFRDDTNNVFKVRGQTTTGGYFGRWTDINGTSGQPFVSQDGANGGPLLFRDNEDSNLWHIWIDEFSGGYKPFETDEVTEYGYTLSKAPSFPKSLKQGSVTPLTFKEYRELTKTITFQ